MAEEKKRIQIRNTNICLKEIELTFQNGDTKTVVGVFYKDTLVLTHKPWVEQTLALRHRFDLGENFSLFQFLVGVADYYIEGHYKVGTVYGIKTDVLEAMAGIGRLTIRRKLKNIEKLGYISVSEHQGLKKGRESGSIGKPIAPEWIVKINELNIYGERVFSIYRDYLKKQVTKQEIRNPIGYVYELIYKNESIRMFTTSKSLKSISDLQIESLKSLLNRHFGNHPHKFEGVELIENAPLKPSKKGDPRQFDGGDTQMRELNAFIWLYPLQIDGVVDNLNKKNLNFSSENKISSKLQSCQTDGAVDNFILKTQKLSLKNEIFLYLKNQRIKIDPHQIDCDMPFLSNITHLLEFAKIAFDLENQHEHDLSTSQIEPRYSYRYIRCLYSSDPLSFLVSRDPQKCNRVCETDRKRGAGEKSPPAPKSRFSLRSKKNNGPQRNNSLPPSTSSSQNDAPDVPVEKEFTTVQTSFVVGKGRKVVSGVGGSGSSDLIVPQGFTPLDLSVKSKDVVKYSIPHLVATAIAYEHWTGLKFCEQDVGPLRRAHAISTIHKISAAIKVAVQRNPPTSLGSALLRKGFQEVFDIVFNFKGFRRQTFTKVPRSGLIVDIDEIRSNAIKREEERKKIFDDNKKKKIENDRLRQGNQGQKYDSKTRRDSKEGSEQTNVNAQINEKGTRGGELDTKSTPNA